MLRRIVALTSVILCAPPLHSARGDTPARTLTTVPSVPAHARRPWRPANVPADYVVTPNGYFHPSCVIQVNEDEVFDHDLHLRGKDGSVRRTLSPCAYPRYGATGRVIRDPTSGSGSGATEPSAFYDGWLVSYWYDTAPLLPNTTVSGKWVVPPDPVGDVTSGNDAVTIFFFNDVEMEVTDSDIEILQPVLGYDQSDDAVWTLQDWNCCANGLEATSTALTVNPGDVLEGVTAGSDCEQSGVCSNWTITGTDLTTGAAPTVLNTTDPNVPNIVNPAVLEAYGVTACDMLPPGGEETFYDHQVTTTTGAEPLSYTLSIGTTSGIPSCGYAGATSGDDFTLIYSSTPAAPATTTTLSATATSVTVGAAVTLTATVRSATTSPPFAGNVSFLDGTTTLSTVDLAGYGTNGGEASASAALAISNLAAGTHSLTAKFLGNNGYQPSASGAVSVMVSKEPTQLSMQATPDTVNEAQPCSLAATLTSSAPANLPAMTGTITFTAGATPLGSASVSSTSSTAGTAQVDASAIPVGTESLKATYSGDAYYAGSTSAVFVVHVNPTLAITPAAPAAPPHGTIPFSTTGGVGPFTWKLTADESGGTIGTSSGRYVAGGEPETSDAVQVTDSLGATSSTTVSVGAGVSVLPPSDTVAALQSISFSATGGSGTGYRWSLMTNNSGGSIDMSTGVYKAGPAANVNDEVLATDSIGNIGTATVAVTPAPVGGAMDAGTTGVPVARSAGCQCDAQGRANVDLLDALGLFVAWPLARRRRRA